MTGGIYNRTKKSISKQAKQQLIKILLAFTLFFKLQNVINNLIHFKTNQRGTYIQGGGGNYNWMYFLFTGRWAYN